MYTNDYYDTGPGIFMVAHIQTEVWTVQDEIVIYIP